MRESKGDATIIMFEELSIQAVKTLITIFWLTIATILILAIMYTKCMHACPKTE